MGHHADQHALRGSGRVRERKGVTPARQAINRHLYRHHEGATGKGSAEQRMALHDDLHWEARQAGTDLGHQHLPYQEGETDEQMAQRLLAEGAKHYVQPE